jgi:selenide,water dikinase
LIGFDTSDDAGVVRLTDDIAIIQTVDFFTPIVDDPFQFGEIAAANALSDVYAMGGTVRCAMNLVCWPSGDLPESVLQAIMNGGSSKLAESGGILVGGHSVRDKELKYGMSVTGIVHPDRVWSNNGGMAGDVLILTKPIGTGVLTTAAKRSAIESKDLLQAVAGMSHLNRVASEVGQRFRVHACTDVTGNGLGGHLLEMVRNTGLNAHIRFGDIPLLTGAFDLAKQGFVPGGTKSNRAYLGDALKLENADEATEAVFLDPQTSGGLLFAVHREDVAPMTSELQARGELAVVIGQLETGDNRVILHS